MVDWSVGVFLTRIKEMSRNCVHTIFHRVAVCGSFSVGMIQLVPCNDNETIIPIRLRPFYWWLWTVEQKPCRIAFAHTHTHTQLHISHIYKTSERYFALNQCLLRLHFDLFCFERPEEEKNLQSNGKSVVHSRILLQTSNIGGARKTQTAKIVFKLLRPVLLRPVLLRPLQLTKINRFKRWPWYV